MRLLDTELRRFHARRMLLVVLLVGVAISGLVATITYLVSQPLTEAQVAEAEQFYADELARWEEDGPAMIAECGEQQASERERSGDETLDFGCDQMGPPQREWYVPEPPELADAMRGSLVALTYTLGFLALLTGTTFTAAEVHTRAITTWLTFEPRRGRVFASKVAAAAIGTMLPAAVLVGLVLAGDAAAFALRGIPVEVATTATGDLVATSVRLWVLAVAVAAVGAALGLLLRHTAAVLGIAVGWAILIEQVVPGLLPRLTPWFVLPNVSAWVQDGMTYYVSECTTTSQGTACDYVERTVSLTQGGLALAGLTIALVVVSLVVFRRRDHA